MRFSCTSQSQGALEQLDLFCVHRALLSGLGVWRHASQYAGTAPSGLLLLGIPRERATRAERGVSGVLLRT